MLKLVSFIYKGENLQINISYKKGRWIFEMGAKTSTEQRPRTFSNSEGAHNHNLTGFNHNHNSSSSSVPAPMTRGSHPFSSNGNKYTLKCPWTEIFARKICAIYVKWCKYDDVGDGARGPVRGRSYSSSAMQSSSASGILELSGRINSFASGFWPVSGENQIGVVSRDYSFWRISESA